MVPQMNRCQNRVQSGQPSDGAHFGQLGPTWETRNQQGVGLEDGFTSWNQIHVQNLARLGLLVEIYFAFLFLV